jgi:hypothetical protein
LPTIYNQGNSIKRQQAAAKERGKQIKSVLKVNKSSNTSSVMKRNYVTVECHLIDTNTCICLLLHLILAFISNFKSMAITFDRENR